MPTLDASRLWRPTPDDGLGTNVANALLCPDEERLVDHPTMNTSFAISVVAFTPSPELRVRNAVRRVVDEFGGALDRLGAE